MLIALLYMLHLVKSGKLAIRKKIIRNQTVYPVLWYIVIYTTIHVAGGIHLGLQVGLLVWDECLL